MNFTFSEEQLQLQESARRFCADRSPSAAVRRWMQDERGFDAAVWREMMAMGWGGIAVPEQYGGLGLGQLEMAIVQQELGRTLLPSPYLSSIVLAATAILEAGSDRQCAALLPGIVAGDTIAALACSGRSGRCGAVGVDAMLARAGDDFVLEGCASFVVSGHVADLFIVAARGADDGAISLVALPRDTPGLSIEKLTAIDMTRPYARLTFAAVRVPVAALLGTPGGSADALARTLALGAIAVAAEQVGAAEHCLAFSVDYTKQRTQFGRPIGSFQALKHKMADMMVLVEAAKSATWYAACAADEDAGQLFEAAAVAKSYCSDAFSQCAGDAIQLHGGIGITWEHDAHLYFKRARATANLLGDPMYQREHIAAGLLDDTQPLLQQLGAR